MKLIKESVEYNSVYLKQIINHLIELNNYPDININYFSYEFGIKTRIRAELTTCTGEIIAGEYIVEDQVLEDKDYREYIEDCLLKEVSFKYIKRAYNAQRNKEVRTRATHYLRSCREIKREYETH